MASQDQRLHGASVRYCGRLFTHEEIERIRRLIAAEPRPNRAQLSRAVCGAFDWVRPGVIAHFKTEGRNQIILNHIR